MSALVILVLVKVGGSTLKVSGMTTHPTTNPAQSVKNTKILVPAPLPPPLLHQMMAVSKLLYLAKSAKMTVAFLKFWD